MHQLLVDGIVIFVAVLASELLMQLGSYLVERRRERSLNIGCDYCEEVRTLYRTPDKHFWPCRKCMEAYLKEHEFSPEKIASVRAKYKSRPPKKIMPKKKHKKRIPSKQHRTFPYDTISYVRASQNIFWCAGHY